jgi:hypothetical protein
MVSCHGTYLVHGFPPCWPRLTLETGLQPLMRSRAGRWCHLTSDSGRVPTALTNGTGTTSHKRLRSNWCYADLELVQLVSQARSRRIEPIYTTNCSYQCISFHPSGLTNRKGGPCPSPAMTGSASPLVSPSWTSGSGFEECYDSICTWLLL